QYAVVANNVKNNSNNFFIHIYLNRFNARLRGWQRITTKLKHNNCNHRGSMGLETPRVDSPS
ncbi:hypothetical protein, partial [Vibrio cholerae]|uniref:hypothetical protein n=1 Tax=Vibrio cholerae TaxID=666 RepID=UPI001C8D580D